MSSDLFYGYNLKTRGMDVSKVVADHIKKFGMPPEILLVNKTDSGSIKSETPLRVEKWVLPNHCFVEIQETEE